MDATDVSDSGKIVGRDREGSHGENRKVRTLYACVAEHETELSFEPNQIIENGKIMELNFFKNLPRL